MTLREKISALTTKRQNTILSASIVLAVTFGISAILGFLRTRFLYSAFIKYHLADLDAFIAAFRLPDLIFKLLVSGALSASFIPVFASYLQKDKEMANKIASTVINLLLIILAVLSLIVIIFANPISRVIANGFTDYQIGLMANLTRILLIAQIFFLLSNFLTGILQVHEIFLLPAISPIVYNLFIILSIFTLTPKFGIYGVAYGTVVGAFFHFAIQVPILKKVDFKHLWNLNTKLPGVKEIIRLMIPRSLSLGLGEIENTVTLFFTSKLSIGSISLLNLALQIIYLPSRIFATTVGQASLPILSKNVAQNELQKFRDTVTKTILQSLFIALPVMVLVIIHRVAIIRIAFGSKQFPWTATLLTAKTLAFIAPTIVFQAIIQILIRSFYALHDTKIPLKISMVSLVIDIAVSYFFVNFTNLGIIGLALSDTLGNLIQCYGLLYFFIKRVDGFNWSEIFNRLLKITIVSALMGAIMWLSLRVLDLFILDTTKTISLIILFIVSSVCGAISFIIFSNFFKVEEFNDYKRHLIKFNRFISNS
jgi:putative peptidoglycan lipid II flippase